MASVIDPSTPTTVTDHLLYVEVVTKCVAAFPHGPQASPALKWELLDCLVSEKSPDSHILLFKDLLKSLD